MSDIQKKKDDFEFIIRLQFQGHYQEQEVEIKVIKNLLLSNDGVLKIKMDYDPAQKNKDT